MGTHPTPTVVRLEYLTPEGEWQLLATHNLIYPERYAERLTQAGKVGRAVETGGRRRVWTSANVPTDPSVLVATTEGGGIPWKLPNPDTCPHCSEAHETPFDGMCLL